MHVVDVSHGGLDAETLQRRLVEQNNAFEALVANQEFDFHLLPCLGIDEHEILHLEAGLLEEPHCFQQIGVHRRVAAGGRVPVGCGEDLRRHGRADGLQ